MDDFFETIRHGKNFDGIRLSSSYLLGNMYGVDGMSLTELGQSAITRHLIDSLNVWYDVNILPVEMKDKRGVEFP